MVTNTTGLQQQQTLADVTRPRPQWNYAANPTLMPRGTGAPPTVPQGSGDDPWVTFMDPFNRWYTQRVRDPTNLLNGNYVVTAISTVNICTGYWAFAYEVKPGLPYPVCRGNNGNFNGGDSSVGAFPLYTDLVYGTCPASVFQYKHRGWMREGYA
jgi:hypothetical protein